ncbi:MAG: ASCH domain-containing protein [Phycisphaerales bacterium]
MGPTGDSARIHVGVIYREYVEAMLAGSKTIESRLAKVRCAPFGMVRAGDRLYIKERGGPVRATAVIERVEYFEDMTPRIVRSLQRRFNDRILGPEEYWRARAKARFGTLLWVKDLEPVRFGPVIPTFYGSAWMSLPASRCVYPECVRPAA